MTCAYREQLRFNKIPIVTKFRKTTMRFSASLAISALFVKALDRERKYQSIWLFLYCIVRLINRLLYRIININYNSLVTSFDFRSENAS